MTTEFQNLQRKSGIIYVQMKSYEKIQKIHILAYSNYLFKLLELRNVLDLLLDQGAGSRHAATVPHVWRQAGKLGSSNEEMVRQTDRQTDRQTARYTMGQA